MPDPLADPEPPRLTIPKDWPNSIQAAMILVIALAQYALAYTRSWAANSPNQRIRLAGKVEQLEQEISLLREEIRIKDHRMAGIPAARRPHYQPTERFAIMQLRAARCWSLELTAHVFQVTSATIASWDRRLDEQGPNALLRTPEPVNKFPNFVRDIVRRLHVLAPTLGKVKTAQILARSGLHLATTTVGRMRREPPDDNSRPPTPKPIPSAWRL